MATMPIRKTVKPSALVGQDNGAIDRSLLAVVDDPRTGWLMATLPARGMRALHAAILKDLGVTLRSTNRLRDLAQQWQIFGGGAARYRPCTKAEYDANTALGKELTKTWPASDYPHRNGEGVMEPAPGRITVAAKLGITIPNSAYWTKIQYSNGGYPATAAEPGTSPHGWGCADDIDARLLSPTVLDWLYTHEMNFGFAHSTLSEIWHVQWFVGDTVPAAVLAYEDTLPKPPPDPEDPPTEDDDMHLGIYITGDGRGTILKGQCTKHGSALIVAWVKTEAELAILRGNPDHIEFDGRDADHPQLGLGNFGACTLLGSIPPGWEHEFAEVVG